MNSKSKTVWVFVLSCVAIFVTALDNLVVTTALPVIQDELGGGMETLEWTVNGYTLVFAVLLLTGAALGDRFGRRRMFIGGLATFTIGSVAAALAPSIEMLVLSRAIQGIGGAIVTPLSLTILAESVPAEKRGMALGVWGSFAGLAIALGPLVGGAITEGIAWQWIFWLNVPVGLAALPLARIKIDESYGPNGRLDLPGLALASTALLGIVWALIRGNGAGWGSPEVLATAIPGLALLVGFVAWELRAPAPMLPMRFFRSRAFAAANAASLAMYFGMFGVFFVFTQYLQLVGGYSAFEAGLRTLPWTVMPLFVNPLAGALSDRVGGRRIMAAGLVLMAIAFAWLAALASPDVDYAAMVPAMFLAGTGTAAFFAPVTNVVMGAVSMQEAGAASGAANAIRELGGVLGVAILGAIIAAQGDYGSATSFVDGFTPALAIAAGLAATGAAITLLIPHGRTSEATVPEPAAQAA